jgi:hypothetical protein
MNPYLEHPHVWHDFHLTYITILRTALMQRLGPAYFAMIRHHAFEAHLPRNHRRKVVYLEIEDVRSDEVVTVVELTGPAVKSTGDDRERYLARRQEMFGGWVNLVELDFMRGGLRVPLKDLPSCDYCALVSRRSDRPETDVWPVRLRDPLPAIPIPLRPGDAEPIVQLQTVLDRAYDGAGYERFIYTCDPEPKLAPADGAWAKELLAAAGVPVSPPR